MYLAEVASTSSSSIDPFDWFMLAFTVVIAIGLYRQWKAKPKRNMFAVGFAVVALAVFLFIDYVMIFEVWLAPKE